MGEYQRVWHGFAPIFDEHSRILILGTMPSVKSREEGFYYGHPRNRFWKLMTALLNSEAPKTPAAKEQLLRVNGIALWDVLGSCEITGSDDHSIRAEEPNDLRPIFATGKIQVVFTNGKKAEALYRKHSLPIVGVQSICLPSTSPANAAWTLEKLIQIWGAAMLPYLQNP